MKSKKVSKIEQTLALRDPEEMKQEIRKMMPKFIAEVENKENMANAMYGASQEMLLVMEDILIKHFKFGNAELKKLHDETRDVLRGVKEFEKQGLSLLSPGDISIVTDKVDEIGIENLLGEIAETHLTKEVMAKSGLDYPTLPGARPFLKELKKQNKK